MADLPTNFLIANQQATKPINVVLEIDGLGFAFGLSKTFKKLVYGAPGVVYGQPGIVYGGLIEESAVKPYLSLDSSLVLQQRIEPEQGRGSTATLTFVLIDKNQEVSQIISNGGGILDEILGRAVTVKAGFTTTSYPADYFVVFRGTISNVVVMSGRISLTVTDANQRRRQAIFQTQKTNLTSGINASVTSIPVLDTSGFPVHILGPNLAYDSSIRTFIKVDDEFMEYGPASVGPTAFSVTRGARGTVAASHAIDAEVTNAVEITGNAIDIALKLMLSGWGDSWKKDIAPQAIGTKIDPALPLTPNAIVLPANADADITYGLTPGDYVTVTGSTASNDGTYIITSLADNNFGTNTVILLGTNLNYELASSTLRIAFRSQFDTLPRELGLKLTPVDVDVAQHELLKNLYFLDNNFSLRLFVQQQQTGKEFIEREIYYPLSAYSLTRFGRLSVGITKPPIAEATLQFLNIDNVLSPENITVTRGLNNRRFFNQVQFEYDPTDEGNFQFITRAFDTDSLNSIGQMTLLPIKASGVRQEFNGDVLAGKTTQRLLQRYKRAAFELRLTVNFEVGIQIEAGDVVAVQDNGQLQILNFDTGTRSLEIALFEVIDRTIDLKTGRVSLVLLSGVGAQFSDRFATIAPSSRITAASTQSKLVIEDSYGAIFPGAEFDKWVDYVGLPIKVHREDYSVTQDVTFVGFDPGNPFGLLIDPALSFIPQAGDIIEIADYPLTTSTLTNALYKTVHAYLSPAVPIFSASNATSFQVAGTFLTLFSVGRIVQVHEPEWGQFSEELTVAGVDLLTQTVTLSGSMGFIPAAGDLVEFIGFADGGGAYRIT